MNKNLAGKTVLVILALIVVAAFALGVFKLIGLAGYHYDNAQKYSAGDTVITEPVRNLDIDWIEGSVNIAYHKEEAVTLSEISDKKISSDKQMRWWLDGDTLRVRYEKQNNRLFSFGPGLKKELTLTLPEGIVLGDAKIDSTSAGLNIPSLQAEKLTMDTTSGDINASVTAQMITGESTSGDIKLAVTEDAQEISVDATSGNIDLKAADADKVRIEATSGNITAAIEKVGDFGIESTSGSIQADIDTVKNAKAESTSGDIRIRTTGLETLKVETTSGDVEALLLSQPGFTAHFDTTSGKVNYDMPLVKEGSTYTCGDGSGDVKINTTSGNITVVSFSDEK